VNVSTPRFAGTVKIFRKSPRFLALLLFMDMVFILEGESFTPKMVPEQR